MENRIARCRYRKVRAVTDLLSNSSAIISDCGTYRYRLDRDYAPTGRAFGPRMAWIMVNPSTADAEQDDATIRKVVGFSRRRNCFRVTVGNLFAYRATDVREIKNAADAIGPDNDKYLREIIGEAQCVVVAWGPVAKQPKSLRERFRRISELADGKPLWCFGTANDGHPRHPLMLAYDTPLIEWSVSNLHQTSDKGPAIAMARDSAETACPAPAPQDCQARCEAIALRSRQSNKPGREM